MVDDDILVVTSPDGIGTIALRNFSKTETQISDNHVVCIDDSRIVLYTYAISRSSLTVNCQVSLADVKF